MKVVVMVALTLSINNDLVDMVAIHTDHADAWLALKNDF
jgi:hypothetical protein